DDLEIRLRFEQRAQAVAHDRVVVGYEHADRHASRSSSTVTVVPAPGAESMRSEAPTAMARSRMPARPQRRVWRPVAPGSKPAPAWTIAAVPGAGSCRSQIRAPLARA